MELGRFLSSLHPVFVHFPIVLLFFGVASDFLFFIRKDTRFSWSGLWMTILGTAMGLIAFVCGILAEVSAARSGIPQKPIEEHEWLATLTMWLFLVLASLRLIMGSSPVRRHLGAYLIFAAIGCGMLFMTAKRGGDVVYTYGANVSGVESKRMPSDEDLASIAQHQAEETLQYSNQMHWNFGWLVLFLGLSVLFERLNLGLLKNLRLIMPFVFIGGGIYLAIYSDWDSWPLSDLRPITDSEVLLHKAMSIIMILIGIAALVRRRRGGDEENRWQWQNKLIAVMGLIGGGLLFTHIHTNAPYTNVAIGVYLHHTAMGTVALGLAGAMLLEEALPHSRWMTRLFPIMLLAESGLLLNYNEDLPWFLGYHQISQKAPRGGLLAHFPGGRAELVFTPDQGCIDVYLTAAKSNVPRPIKAQRLRAIVEAKHQKSVLWFEPADDAIRTHHFQSHAPWLRHVPMFAVRLEIPEGKHVAPVEFEPWVTAPILPPLVGAETVYACPMCSDVRSSRPGICPMCRMRLTPIRDRSRMFPQSLPPHDPEYRMELTSDPNPPQEGQPVELTWAMRITADGAIVRSLRMVHEKLMHLMIVRKDLSWFAHVHPQIGPDGLFRLRQIFPEGGDYVLFADLSPADTRTQIFRIELHVRGHARSSIPLHENDGLVRSFDGYHVSMLLTPHAPHARNEAQLTFSISHAGRPVDDLGLFLGALGHCVIIHEDSKEFIHTHAVQLTAATPPPGGPDIMFHALLPKPGRYKVWGQFNHHGKVITADFVFRVL